MDLPIFLQNYASTANIQEVTKFYNLGNENFETDCSTEKMDMGIVTQKYRNSCEKIPCNLMEKTH